MTTRDQERKALEQIRKIIEGLSEDSYVGFAMIGVFEDAEKKINNDCACSNYDRWQLTEQRVEELKQEVITLRESAEELKQEVITLRERAENMNNLRIEENQKVMAPRQEVEKKQDVIRKPLLY